MAATTLEVAQSGELIDQPTVDDEQHDDGKGQAAEPTDQAAVGESPERRAERRQEGEGRDQREPDSETGQRALAAQILCRRRRASLEAIEKLRKGPGVRQRPRQASGPLLATRSATARGP